ncbi:MAG: phosphate/phosphite/phosphonate ABC transporter substrate-binding protein [Alkalilacustris sp.]
MYAAAASAIRSIEDMEGRSLAYADPDSTSGFLVPQFALRQAGIDDRTFFSRAGFAGGHEQAVIAVLNGQFDAGVTWMLGVGDPAEGYTRGTLRRMVDNGLLNTDDQRIIWESEIIPNGPVVFRTDLPAEAREIVPDYLENQIEIDPD